MLWTLHICFKNFIQLRILFQLFLKFTFQCLSWALQLTLFTINHNKFTGMEKEELSSWSVVLYCWACSELSVGILFEENHWPSLFLLIFFSNLNEYYFLSRICNAICRELCAILVQIYIICLSVRLNDKKMIISVAIPLFWKNKIISSLLRRVFFFSQHLLEM